MEYYSGGRGAETFACGSGPGSHYLCDQGYGVIQDFDIPEGDVLPPTATPGCCHKARDDLGSTSIYGVREQGQIDGFDVNARYARSVVEGGLPFGREVVALGLLALSRLRRA